MIRLIWTASVFTRRFLRHYMPTNILLDFIRTRRGLKWGVPAMLLGVVYILAAAACEAGIRAGWPGWTNLLVTLLAWNGLKFLVIGPVSAAMLIAARVRETRSPRTPRASSQDTVVVRRASWFERTLRP